MNETICALATPTGGALAIIRISGPNTLSVVEKVCGDSIKTASANSIRFFAINDEDGKLIDEVMVSVFHAPHSYTGEDSAEISCHGSTYIAQQIINLLVRNGCRMALPGEYTQRAYLNGKLDLSQAEAVADLIASTNRATHQMAISQLRGHFSSELSLLRQQLLRLTSLLELELDFSDHEDLEFADRNELLELSKKIEERITTLSHSFEVGQALKQGIPVAIVGKTNVGKSTLLNRLLKDDRAIVSDIHGTTRDTIEDTIFIHGIQFRFIDTAGIRATSDEIEQIGIDRTYQAIERASIILWIIDDEPTSDELKKMQDIIANKKIIIIQNKIDIFNKLEINLPATMLHLSAKYDKDLQELEEHIYTLANVPEINENSIIVNNVRHYEALIHANESLLRVIKGLSTNQSGDLLAEDLRLCINQLGEITGVAISSEETLQNIFKHFCVGK